jgi:uncharacterized protein with von Willebrand factor type A (vWA) domain
MLINFFLLLRSSGVPVSLREWLDLLEAIERHLSFGSVEGFYYLARSILVKDEKFFNRYDRAFSSFFEGFENFQTALEADIPKDWLNVDLEQFLSAEDKKRAKALGGLDKLLEEFRKRLLEQGERHSGGNKWIGTGGTSQFGHSGYNPEGIRIGGSGGNRRAIKVWNKRIFSNLDDTAAVSSRNIKIAMRRVRKMARAGVGKEFDLDATITATAKNGGLLDIKMVPEVENTVKVLLFFDVGGSMDYHIGLCEEVFSAARSEFKSLEYFYFHNCIYENVWKDNTRREEQRTSLFDVINKYSHEYKIIFVGDASMSPYEIFQPGGSVEHWNDETGATWLSRVVEFYNRVVWLNPMPLGTWQHTQSIGMINTIMNERMYPLTLKGMEEAMVVLAR